MRCQIAISVFPFQRGVRAGIAVPAGGKFLTAFAAFTLLYDYMANPAIIGTSLSGHKRTLFPISDSCTNHLNHPLVILFESTNIKKGLEHICPAFSCRLKNQTQYNCRTDGCQPYFSHPAYIELLKSILYTGGLEKT